MAVFVLSPHRATRLAPRPVIRSMARAIRPRIGERIYDGACGSAGFLCEAYDFLRPRGRAAIVIKGTFLSNSDNASVALRKELLESCNLFTVLDMPGGTFQGVGVKTVVLFFEKGAPTKFTWYYQPNPGRNLGKTNPLNDTDLADFVKKQASFADSSKSWSVARADIDETTSDLPVKNPNVEEDAPLREPGEIIAVIRALDVESEGI